MTQNTSAPIAPVFHLRFSIPSAASPAQAMVTAHQELLQYRHWIHVCVYILLTPVVQPTNHCWIKAPQTLFLWTDFPSQKYLGASHFLEKKTETFYTGTQYLV